MISNSAPGCFGQFCLIDRKSVTKQHGSAVDHFSQSLRQGLHSHIVQVSDSFCMKQPWLFSFRPFPTVKFNATFNCGSGSRQWMTVMSWRVYMWSWCPSRSTCPSSLASLRLEWGKAEMGLCHEWAGVRLVGWTGRGVTLTHPGSMGFFQAHVHKIQIQTQTQTINPCSWCLLLLISP